MQGHSEVPLNDNGIAQAGRLADRLRGIGVDRIHSSDLRRAAMTAAIIAARTGAPVVWDPTLRERDPGELTERPYDEVMEFFNDWDFIPPGGESFPDFDERVRQSFGALVRNKANRGLKIAIVSHGMVCAAFLRTCLGDPGDEMTAIRWRNAALSIVDYDGSWKPVLLADASHLDEPEDASASATGA